MGLKAGDKIPSFFAKDTNGNDFNSQDLIGKKPLVIYPKKNKTLLNFIILKNWALKKLAIKWVYPNRGLLASMPKLWKNWVIDFLIYLKKKTKIKG